MPAGFSAADFFYILPELVLTGGALLAAAAIARLAHGRCAPSDYADAPPV